MKENEFKRAVELDKNIKALKRAVDVLDEEFALSVQSDIEDEPGKMPDLEAVKLREGLEARRVELVRRFEKL